jgi:hypothetical protein
MAELKKLTPEELARRILVLPEEQQLEAIEYLSQIYQANQGKEFEQITIGRGTEYEVTLPVHMLPTLDELVKRDNADLADPSTGPGRDMPGWEARVPVLFVEAYKREVAERLRQVGETMAMFDGMDEETQPSHPKTF